MRSRTATRESTIKDFLNNNFFFYPKQPLIANLVDLKRFRGSIMDKSVSHQHKNWVQKFKIEISGVSVQVSEVLG